MPSKGKCSESLKKYSSPFEKGGLRGILIDRQVTGRNDPCPCGSGKKYKKCCGTEDSVQLGSNSIPLSQLLESVAYHRRMAYIGSIGRKRKEFCTRYSAYKSKTLQSLAGRQVEEAKSLGKTVSCHKGCSFCCDYLVAVSIQESEAIVHYLYENEGALNAFLDRYPTWYNELSRHRDLLARISQATGVLSQEGVTPEKVGEMESILRRETTAFWNLHLHCPFLVDDACSIHPVRPFTCAGHYSLSPAEYCDLSLGKEAEVRVLSPEFDAIQGQFWDERLNAPYEDMLPNVVFSTLTGGFGYLSGLPGLDKLYADFQNKPEVEQFNG